MKVRNELCRQAGDPFFKTPAMIDSTDAGRTSVHRASRLGAQLRCSNSWRVRVHRRHGDF